EGELGTANGNVTRLEGELGTANGNVTRLEGELETARTTMGSPDDAADDSADASLHAQLNAAKARIAELEAGTAPDVLDPIKMAASGAASDADDAYMAADRAAGEAEDADDNRATLQTGDANSVADAEAARGAANTAMAEAKKAQDAADAANAASNASDATAEKVKADNARDEAMMAQTEAEGHRDNAVADSMVELKIDGTVKSVGDTEIDAMAGASSVTIDGQTTITGLIESMNPEQTAPAFEGRDGVQDNPATDADEAVAYRQAVDERTFDVGKVVDSADDMARLMIVTQYAGSTTVKTFYQTPLASGGENIVATHVAGSRAGQIFIHNGPDGTPQTDDDVYADLVSRGMFYPVTSSAGTQVSGVDLDATDTVAADAKPQEVWSYLHLGADGEPGGTGGDADGVRYVIMRETETTHATDTVEITYARVDIMVTLPVAGEVAARDIQTTAQLPEATAYDHIHFGVWAGLKAAAKDGSQDIADLGIGFVQSIGDGMTGADMPNNGSGTYEGNWVATVQAADPDGDGAITLTSGAASLAADFGEGEITATLTGLATLEGDISGSEFSGTKATVAANDHGLTASSNDVTFTGSFTGGFYGSKAAEAGGIFDFASEDNEAGAFRGAFGADRK
ncbi:MAG: transferrin-binding protein-like solute binding protein, partial [Deltaproteobacteria bacterium]|nr:transferrin-binding protein-like solute binding protein [Deltaproteobacteria bacterium]